MRSSPDSSKGRISAKLRRKGITPTPEMIALIEDHDGFCSICTTEKPGGRWNIFVIDHCHRTGRFRGLLCDACNKALGMFDDDVDRLKAAILYLTD